MRRLPKQRLYRGLLKAKMITEKDIPLIQQKLADFKRYQQLNVAFTNNRGHRWANRLQSFARWLWENRESILQILGLVIMFAEDGTPTVREESELDRDTLKAAKRNLAKRKPTKFTPHGEKVEDFTEPVEKPKRKRKTKAEKAMDEITNDAQEAGLYDIGLDENPLVKDSDDEESNEGEVEGNEGWRPNLSPLPEVSDTEGTKE